MSVILNTPGTYLFILILIEAGLTMKDQWWNYRLKDSLANLVIAFIFFSSSLFTRGLVLYLLTTLQNFSFFQFGNSWTMYLFLFFLSDLLHYFLHRLEHSTRLLWTLHSIHHSSDFYNLSIAVRTPVASNMYRLIYTAPLCLLGFDAAAVFTVETIIILYAFLLHTELVKKLGSLECVFNTPSHHRVHHSSDEKYIDKNFGGVFIFWDRIFGTFQDEQEKPNYGLSGRKSGCNPVKIVFSELHYLIKDISRAKSLKLKLNFMINPPGWQPDPADSITNQHDFDPEKKVTPCNQVFSIPVPISLAESKPVLS